MTSNDDKPLSPSDAERFKQLFSKLDVNKDGKIEVRELAEGLQSMRGGVASGDAKGQAQVSANSI